MSRYTPPLGPVLTVIALATVGLALGGLLGAGTTMAALAVLWSERARHEHLLFAAMTLLAVAAIMTVIEAPIDADRIGASYATERPVAAQAGMLAGLLLIVTVTDLARARRLTPSQRRAENIASVPEELDRSGRWRPSAVAILPLVAGSATAAIAALIGPDALSPLAGELATNVSTGVGYGRIAENVFHPSALHAPLGPLLAGLGPGSPQAQLAAVVGVGSGLAVTLAVRLGGLAAGVGTGLVVLCTPLLWSQQLPAAIATAAVTLALVVTVDRPRSTRRTVVAALCVAVATLAVPWALIAMVVLVPWRAPRPALTMVIVVSAVVAPWALWVHDNFDTPLPTTDAIRYLADASAPEATGGAGIGGRAPSPLPPPGTEPPDASIRWAHHLQPQVMAARALRTWDLWPPAQVTRQRDALGLPNPGGVTAIVLTWPVLVAALWGSRYARRRRLTAVVALPVVMTAAAMVSAGERNLASLSAGAISVLVGIAVATVWSARSRFHHPAAAAEDVRSTG